MQVSFRPAASQDRALLMRVYASTREQELALTSWSESERENFARLQYEAQERHYLQQFPRSECKVIVAHRGTGPHDLGRLWLDRRPTSLHVLDISLLPEARNQGIGTFCLRLLMEECQERGKALSIYVELHNPARRLYERLGLEAEGVPQGLYQRMGWQPITSLCTDPEEYLR